MTKHYTFHVSINGREEQTITVPTDVHHVAVMACLSLSTEEDFHNIYNIPIHIKIWVPHPLPMYDPYNYIIGYTDKNTYSCWGVGDTTYDEAYEIIQRGYIGT